MARIVEIIEASFVPLSSRSDWCWGWWFGCNFVRREECSPEGCEISVLLVVVVVVVVVVVAVLDEGVGAKDVEIVCVFNGLGFVVG